MLGKLVASWRLMSWSISWKRIPDRVYWLQVRYGLALSVVHFEVALTAGRSGQAKAYRHSMVIIRSGGVPN